ncbi:hypothetical protein E2C01_046304 [Portunus trituberculatus]|uniref:Uncharacterized protein n=1 Tax=Portunus trituberculatus TaxID=210409 RepID=A0A5B7G4V5_PORTR|nr:hypothetical protein [Portunus trituberculatus]
MQRNLQWMSDYGRDLSEGGLIHFRPNEMRSRDFDANEAACNFGESSTQEPLTAMAVYEPHPFIER